MIRFALVLALSLGCVCAQAQTLEKAVPQSPAELHPSFAPVVKKVRPAVVNVYASRVETMPRNPLLDDPIFRQFFGQQGQESRVAQSLGSGVIVDAGGLVVTNHHVIEGMTDVKVALSDHREFEAKIVLRDPRTDLAVLQIQSQERFPVLELGDSDAIEVGDIVLAIGNPFGVGQTVTQGIVSALARTQIGINDYGFFIQTDAAINPGNSGGALVDLDGRLIGVNSAIYSRSGGSMGIGFAIPVNMVKSVVAAAMHGAPRSGGRGLAQACKTSPRTSPIPSGWSAPSGRWWSASLRAARRRRRACGAATSSPRLTGKASTTPKASASGSPSSPWAASRGCRFSAAARPSCCR